MSLVGVLEQVQHACADVAWTHDYRSVSGRCVWLTFTAERYSTQNFASKYKQ